MPLPLQVRDIKMLAFSQKETIKIIVLSRANGNKSLVQGKTFEHSTDWMLFQKVVVVVVMTSQSFSFRSESK
ncbi:unnamed protein product [Ixodes pacificus]